MPTTLLLSFRFLFKPPPPTLIQPQRITARLFLAPNLLRAPITILILPPNNLHALFFVSQQRPQNPARSAT
jgi:hypothetical protein